MKRLVDGVLVDLTAGEISAHQGAEGNSETLKVRLQRNLLLESSDIHALADTITADWATYRQALRDITGQAGFPYSTIWPTKP